MKQAIKNKIALKTATYKIVLELGTASASFQAQAKAIRQGCKAKVTDHVKRNTNQIECCNQSIECSV